MGGGYVGVEGSAGTVRKEEEEEEKREEEEKKKRRRKGRHE